ncbi:MAG: aldose 1-epimerase [Oscillibacter sp.]|nr:aldose 1-epimerase [Oscillibacter sp.]
MRGKTMPMLIELAAGPWAACILPAFGMNTVSLSFYGKPILRAPPSLRKLEEDSCAYGIPVLLPPNRTDQGRFTFDGICYQLPQNDQTLKCNLHGVLHQRPFTIMERTKYAVLAVYESAGEDYPFSFSLEVLCKLDRAGYRQQFVIKNTGNQDMPLTFGLHTTFLEQGLLRVDLGKRWVLNERMLPTGEVEPLRQEEAAYLRGGRFRGQKIHGFYTASGHTAQIGNILYTVSENFDHWVLWNGDGKQGFCTIEPLQGGINALNSGEGLIRLKPGQRAVFETNFQYAEARKSGLPCLLYIPDGVGGGMSRTPTGGKQYRRCPPPDRYWTYP